MGGGISRVLYRSRGKDHFSGSAVTGALEQPTRDSNGAGRSSPLFGLAPSGVYRAIPVTRGAVRSYRTLSPLPVLPGEPSAVCSLLHFPSPRGARPLAGTLPFGARTFLDTRGCRGPHSPPDLSNHLAVPRRGLEPPRRFRHQILSLACLPVSAPGRPTVPSMLPRGLEPPRGYPH